MTIDERIEALTQSVELMVHENRSLNQFIKSTTQENREGFKIVAENITDLAVVVNRMSDDIGRLAGSVDALIERMDKTDVRWNQLIDILGRQHSNGQSPQ